VYKYIKILGMKAFTYLIKEKETGKWYYGVRYASNCCISDMFTTYFTSGVLHDRIKSKPDDFVFEIRKQFDSVEDSLNWEHTVLRRMKIKERTDCYNKHIGKAPPRMFGDDNPSRRSDVKLKISAASKRRGRLSDKSISTMRQTKIRQGVIRMIKTKSFVIKKSCATRYKNYLSFIERIQSKKKYTRIHRLIKRLLEECLCYKPKPYPKNRKRTGPRGKNHRISNSKIGKRWYTNPNLLECKLFSTDDNIPNGWIAGMKLSSKIEKNKLASTGRKHTEESKLKMKHICNERN